jgi:hypothetical protein
MVQNTAQEGIMPADETLHHLQRLRLRRFYMALITYAFVFFALFLIGRLGLGELNKTQLIIFIGLALFGNIIFFVLFYTNTNLRFSDPSLTREQIIYSAIWGTIPLYALPEAHPIVLMFYLPSFSFGMLRLTLRKYLTVVAWVLVLYAVVLILEYFQYRQKFIIQYELFLFVLFAILLTWFAFFGGFVSNLRRQLRAQNIEIQKAQEEIKVEIEERRRAQADKDNLIIKLQDALTKVKTLSGLFPICSSCKKIRDDKGYWNQIESYIRDHSNAEFSHSICPDCAKKLYPDMDI